MGHEIECHGYEAKGLICVGETVLAECCRCGVVYVPRDDADELDLSEVVELKPERDGV